MLNPASQTLCLCCGCFAELFLFRIAEDCVKVLVIVWAEPVSKESLRCQAPEAGWK